MTEKLLTGTLSLNTNKNHAEFWISVIRFLDIHNSFLDIQNQCMLGYPKIHFWISKDHTELRISIIRFLDIHNSFLDIQKSVYLRISDIQKSC